MYLPVHVVLYDHVEGSVGTAYISGTAIGVLLGFVNILQT